MRLKNISSKLLLAFSFPFRFFKKTKLSSFATGIIFGALFSLVVNVVTVKLQEDISKQRTLEALEREIVGHFLTSNSIFRDQDSALEATDGDYVFPITISFRYKTRVFESSEVTSYLFEIEPSIAAKIESYYDFIISNANQNLDRNEANYNKLSERCQPIYDILFQTTRESVKLCNELTRNVLVANTAFAEMIYDDVDDIRKDFHPTQDRLDSWWLSLLLGNKAYEVVKMVPADK